MVKPRKVRAQLKFAQGAYVPPQSTLPVASTQGVVNASHRAVSAPGPVTKNECSVNDLLTRMSLGRAHQHKASWPMVILEDCSKLKINESEKRKLGVKKRPSRRVLRKRPVDIADRIFSVSDSGEDNDDKPLSHLQTQQDSPSKQIKHIIPDATGESATGSPLEIDGEKAKDIVDRTYEKIGLKRTENIHKNEKKTFCLDREVKVIVERQILNQTKSLTQSSELKSLQKRRSLKRHADALVSKSNMPSSLEPDDRHDQPKLQRTSERCATRRGPKYSDNPASTKILSTELNNTPTKQKLLIERAVVNKPSNNLKRKKTMPKKKITNKARYASRLKSQQPVKQTSDNQEPESNTNWVVTNPLSPIPTTWAHQHKASWPMGILEDCSKLIIIEGDKRKLGLKKRPSRRVLRKRPVDIADRIFSVSDSVKDNDDKPLSHLQTQQDSPSKQIKHIPDATGESATGSPLEIDGEKAKDIVDRTYEKIGLKRTENIHKNEKKTFCLDREVKVIVERQILNQTKSLTQSSELKSLQKRRSLKRHACFICMHANACKSNMPSSLEPDDRHDQPKLQRTSERCATRRGPKYSDNPASTKILSTELNNTPTKQKLLIERAVVNKPSNNLKRKKTMPKNKITNKARYASRLKSQQPVKQTSDNQEPESNTNWVVTNPLSPIPTTYETCLDNVVISDVKSLCEDIETTPGLLEPTNSPFSSDGFKVPSVPVRFTKSSKIQCPLTAVVDLQELLRSEVGCNACPRCMLVTKYRKSLERVPMSMGDDPDILESDQSRIQHPNRGVRGHNVPTLERLLMYESNDEAGALKLLNEDATDILIERLITRLEFLDECQILDNMKLEEEDPEQCSQTVKPVTRHPSQTSCPLKTEPIPSTVKTEPMQPILSDNTQKTNGEMDRNNTMKPMQPMPTDNILKSITDRNKQNALPAPSVSRDASTTEARFLVVRLTPLPEVPDMIANRAVDTTPYSEEIMNTEPTQTEQPLEQNQPADTGLILPVLEFRPTLEEFKDPIAYIKSIEPKASLHGMCKIIPPDGFNVRYHLDENCVFGTTNQHLGRLYHRWGPNTREMATIQTYLASRTPRDTKRFTKAPLFNGIEIDLVKLYHLVMKQGGIEGYLGHNEKWARIAAQMNLVSPRSKPDSKLLEKLYCKHVLPYESLTSAERDAWRDKADEIWKIRVKNAIKRASSPLHYQSGLLSESISPEYEEALPSPDLAELYDTCKPIFDKIEECTGKGRAMSLATFQRISARFQAMRFPSGLPSTIAEIERHYWELLNRGDEHVCVPSAFIDTSVNNLGHESDPKKPGGSHPWNLKRIGENPKNILSSLGKALSVTVPTLCLNQLYSTNCLHMDPHKLAWLDYMHNGATKIWYSVPDKGAPALRRAVKMMTEAAVQDKGIWLASDTTMIPPGNLVACGVPVRRIEQNPNEYIVVFPGAYACSISTGFSISESIYFQSYSWLDHVEKVFEDMHNDCEPAMFSCVLLMMNIARNPTRHLDVLLRVFTILKKLFKEEFQARNEAQSLNCKITTDTRGRVEGNNVLPVSWPNQKECCLCRIPLVLSKMSKYDEPRKQMCINHGTKYMRIVSLRPESERPEQLPVVTLHYTNQELIEMLGTLKMYLMVIDE